VTAQTFDEAIERILVAANRRVQFRAHFCTVHSLVEASKDQALAQVFQSASMVCTDGMPVVWLARRRGGPTAERVAGPDAMLAVCDRGRAHGLRHFFLGGTPGTAETLARRLARRYPGLDVAGSFAPPFRVMTAAEIVALAQQIAATGAHIVWIGLGSPKQEFFAANEGRRFGSAVVMPVGAAFDFHAGRLPRAPRWMQRLGLEWLFRLLSEPRRLAGRYLVTNTRFIYLVAREELRRRLQPRGGTSGSADR
jgi:N-acetylglucosaminyldiphosphoundecaprenol N-acetyl-beta-D-mannosaminyltransferase